MVQTHSHRERRNAIAAWLRDRYGPADDDDMPDAAYWKDAADLLKFLTANGLRVMAVDEDTKKPQPIPTGASSETANA